MFPLLTCWRRRIVAFVVVRNQWNGAKHFHSVSNAHKSRLAGTRIPRDRIPMGRHEEDVICGTEQAKHDFLFFCMSDTTIALLTVFFLHRPQDMGQHGTPSSEWEDLKMKPSEECYHHANAFWQHCHYWKRQNRLWVEAGQ